MAAGVDYLIGDPWNWLHPVQVMGWIINYSTQLILNFCSQLQLNLVQSRRLGGIILGLGLIIGSGFTAWLLIRGLTRINFWLGSVTEIILLASCFAGKSLRVAVKDVLDSFGEGDLSTARSRLSLYVGRDTDNLCCRWGNRTLVLCRIRSVYAGDRQRSFSFSL